MDLGIRPASEADAHGIARVFLDSAEHHASLDPDRFSIPGLDAVMERYRTGAQHPPGTTAVTLVAELADETVGFVDARLERSPDPMLRPITYCYIAELAVGVVFRHRGIGRQLLAAAEDWGRRHGAGFASLDYHVSNRRAAAFYEQTMGYHSAHVVAIKRLHPR